MLGSSIEVELLDEAAKRCDSLGRSILMDGSIKFAGSVVSSKWLLFALVVCCISLLTLTISPPIWQDEVQILEFGRTTLHPTTDWSLNTTIAGQPAFLLSYVGPVFQETAYALTESPVGPRLSALIGAVIAAFLCRVWLILRGMPVANASLISAIVLLEPTFAQSYRGARADSWALAFAFAGLSALQVAFSRKDFRQTFSWCMAAGAFTALAAFTWVSAILLWPLVLAEVVISRYPRKVMVFAAGTAGMLLMAMVLILPVWDRLLAAVALLFTHTHSDSFAHSLRLQLPELADTVKLSPFLFLVALCGAVTSRRQWLIGGLFALVLLSMLLTRMYVHRYIYLLPYMCVLVGGLSMQLNRFGAVLNALKWDWGHGMLAGLFLWACLLTLVVRPCFALRDASGRSPGLLDKFVAEHLEPGEPVYLDAWEFYYACRNSGSSIWRAYDYEVPHDADILDKVTCIVAKRPLEARLSKVAQERGFRANEFQITPLQEHGRWVGASPYGPAYVVMRK